MATRRTRTVKEWSSTRARPAAIRRGGDWSRATREKPSVPSAAGGPSTSMAAAPNGGGGPPQWLALPRNRGEGEGADTQPRTYRPGPAPGAGAPGHGGRGRGVGPAPSNVPSAASRGDAGGPSTTLPADRRHLDRLGEHRQGRGEPSDPVDAEAAYLEARFLLESLDR